MKFILYKYEITYFNAYHINYLIYYIYLNNIGVM